MKGLPRDRDFIAGVLFLVVAAVFLYEAFGLHLGRAVEMGPGYLPALVSGLLLVLSLALIGKAIVARSVPFERLELGPIGLVTIAIVLFGVLIRTAGLITATSVVVMISSFAAHDVRWKEAILLSAGLCAAAVIVFVKLLKLPFAL